MVVYSVGKLSSYSNGAVQNIAKIHQERTENTYKCKCGHSVSIPIFVDKTICSFCGNYVFKNKQDEFRFRVKEKLK